jgi:hypothetical protein
VTLLHPIADIGSTDIVRQTDVGYIAFPGNSDARLAGESSTTVVVCSDSTVSFYDSDAVLQDTFAGRAKAVFSDVVFMESGAIVALVDGVATQRGTFVGTPVSKIHTIHDGWLHQYDVDQTGRMSHRQVCECPMPSGDIVYSGFSSPKFIVVSQRRTIVFAFADDTYSLEDSFAHETAVGFLDGNVILEGSVGPGKLSGAVPINAVAEQVFQFRRVDDSGVPGPTKDQTEAFNLPSSITVDFGTTVIVPTVTPVPLGEYVLPLTAGPWSYGAYVGVIGGYGVTISCSQGVTGTKVRVALSLGGPFGAVAVEWYNATSLADLGRPSTISYSTPTVVIGVVDPSTVYEDPITANCTY